MIAFSILTFFFRHLSLPALSTSTTHQASGSSLAVTSLLETPFNPVTSLWDPSSLVFVLFITDLFFFRQLSSTPTLSNCLGSSLAVASPLDTPFIQSTILYCEVHLFCGCVFETNLLCRHLSPSVLIYQLNESLL